MARSSSSGDAREGSKDNEPGLVAHAKSGLERSLEAQEPRHHVVVETSGLGAVDRERGVEQVEGEGLGPMAGESPSRRPSGSLQQNHLSLDPGLCWRTRETNPPASADEQRLLAGG
jgi:hypothetical protein